MSELHREHCLAVSCGQGCEKASDRFQGKGIEGKKAESQSILTTLQHLRVLGLDASENSCPVVFQDLR